MAVLPREKRLSLIARHGHLAVSRAMADDSLQHFTVPQIEGFLGYRRRGPVILVPGEPVCPRENSRALFEAFGEMAKGEGASICFFGCSPRLCREAGSAGYTSIKFGQEAIIDVGGFSLVGNRMENVRRGLNHSANVGISVREYVPQEARDPALEEELAEVSRDWLSGKRTPELGFLLGGMELSRPEGRRIFVARRRRRVDAFIILVPVPPENGWYTDVMRRRRDAPNGVMEKLIVEILGLLRDENAERLFLGMVPFVGIDTEGDENTALHRLMDHLRGRIDFLYSIDTEHFFKNKFHPDWRDVFMLVHPRLTARMAKAVIDAFLPTGLLGVLKHRFQKKR